MSARYFAKTPISGDRAVLDGPEAHHLIHVMRAAAGTEVALFDGRGAEFPARVTRIGRGRVELAVIDCHEVDRELLVEVTLAVALPKGDRQRWLVEKAVELGVRRLVPLVTERSVVRPSPKSSERLRRSVVEASKQCGRNRLMEIAEAEAWTDFAVAAPEDTIRLLAHPTQNERADVKEDASLFQARGADKPIIFAVGPEGGFTPDEIAAAVASGWQQIDLGPRILRVETAAVALAAMASLRLLA